MSEVRAKVVGLEEYRVGLTAAQRENLELVEAAVARASRRLFGEAKTAAPRRRTPIRNRRRPPLAATVALVLERLVGTVGTPSPQGRWLEFGTKARKTRAGWNRGAITARPWLGGPFERAAAAFQSELTR